MTKHFALIGAAGFVAPRHMAAIKTTGNNLVAALDLSDSVGIIDTHFPDADFFTEFERFDRHLDKLRRKGQSIDFLSVCSPNYLHDAHSRFGLRIGADVICEKPLVLNSWNIDGLKEIERDTGKRVYCILQLRLHPVIIALREEMRSASKIDKIDVNLTYITGRGRWYHASWKGNVQKSGGVATNIGVHFFDMLTWVFGDVESNVVHMHNDDAAAGYLELERARVSWFLSTNVDHVPAQARAAGKRTHRSISVRGREIEFSEGFTDLHTESYRGVLSGEGFGVEDARRSIEVVQAVRTTTIDLNRGRVHAMAQERLGGRQ